MAEREALAPDKTIGLPYWGGGDTGRLLQEIVGSHAEQHVRPPFEGKGEAVGKASRIDSFIRDGAFPFPKRCPLWTTKASTSISGPRRTLSR